MLVEMAGFGEALDPKQGEKHDAAGRSLYPHCSHFGWTHWTGHSGEGRESCLASGPTMGKEIIEMEQRAEYIGYILTKSVNTPPCQFSGLCSPDCWDFLPSHFHCEGKC